MGVAGHAASDVDDVCPPEESGNTGGPEQASRHGEIEFDCSMRVSAGGFCARLIIAVLAAASPFRS